MPVKNQVQLITYPDSLGGNLKTLNHLLRKYFADSFKGGIHILPPFPSSGDRGFAPLTYYEIDPRFGTWEDIRQIAENFDILLDLMVNHISRQSPYFQDFIKKGRNSAYADLFITLDKIWPAGPPPREDVEKIFLRKPEHPFSDIVIEETGQVERIWTTFSRQANWAEQIDLDVCSPATRQLLIRFLSHFRRQNVSIIRLDAIGYVIKKPGTSCFMVEPEIYEFIDWLVEAAASLGLELLPEVHAHYSVQFKLAEHGYWVYDFVLPLLILYTLQTKSSRKLRDYLKVCPRKQFTMLDCHDGIPVQPDLDGILTPEEARKVVNVCLQRGANLNRILSSAHKTQPDFDAHQINCTYYSALANDDDLYLAARAIQFFAPGVPQVYYVGLLAGQNDPQGVQETGEGRAVNRHNYSVEEVAQAVQTKVVQRLLNLIHFRNEHRAFNGDFSVQESNDQQLILAWQKAGTLCRLEVDLNTGRAVILYTGDSGETIEHAV
ncbi:MAG: sucrose phosphorylase [Anaerolineae bacterium]|nr:sucrose phosphorylase [Anaerolineae bacterium]